MAGQYKILVDQGSTWNLSLRWLDSNGAPVNLTGYAARMHIRESCDASTIIENLTTENGGITVTSSGYVNLTLTATETAAMTAGDYVYDVELVVDTTVTRILEGELTVRCEVTR